MRPTLNTRHDVSLDPTTKNLQGEDRVPHDTATCYNTAYGLHRRTVEHIICVFLQQILLADSELLLNVVVQWNVSYLNMLGPNPVRNSEYSVTLKLGKAHVYHIHIECNFTPNYYNSESITHVHMYSTQDCEIRIFHVVCTLCKYIARHAM